MFDLWERFRIYSTNRVQRDRPFLWYFGRAGRLCLPQLGESHPRATTFFVRPLPFSLSVCNGGGGSRRSEAYCRADHQIRNFSPSQRFDGMVQPTQERLCHMGTHGWKQSLWFFISGRNNKNKSPGWLVSLVIGDYLAWFGEHLLG